MRHAFLFATLLVLLLGIAQPAQAASEDGPLKRKIKERIFQKMAEKPAPAPTASLDDIITKPGDYYFAMEHGGLHRMYKLHVPKGYSAKNPAPLVVAIHGGGGDMDYMSKDEYYGLITKSEQENTLVVFPNGFSKLPSGKLATFNAGACCGGARDNKVDDVGFIRNIVAHLEHALNVDSRRIYATGMSNGGMMSYKLACEAADIFAAIAPVAGTDGVAGCKPSRPVPVLHIHALNDDHVLFNGGAGDTFSIAGKGAVTEFRSVPDTVALWVKRDGCDTAPENVLKKDDVTCELYSHCNGAAAVKICITAKGAHSWPGGYKSRGEPTSKAISANDMMWDFFKAHPLPQQ